MTEPHARTSSSAAAPASVDGAPLELFDLREHPDEQLLAEIHDGLYLRSFPRREEREDFETLRKCLWGEDCYRPPLYHFVVARSTAGVAGFVVCEYYPRSRCGLLSYLAVEPSARRKGVGRTLLQRAIEVLRADAEAAGGTLAAVFSEVHDPAKVEAADDVIDPLDRVRIVERLGARRVPIPYVQPELEPGRGRSRTLMLVAYPTDEKELRTLESEVVRAFLEELYEILGCEGPDRDLDLARSLIGVVDEPLELEELLPVEEPRLQALAEYGIAFHIPVRRPRRAHGGSELEVGSFEDDILAYAYRRRPPLRTLSLPVPDDRARVAVHFAGEATYFSEGRRVTLRCADGPEGRTRHFLLRASRTDFRTSDLSILHLVLGPDPGTPDSRLNEYDLIKLMKLWHSGEGMSLDGVDVLGERYLSFRAGGREWTLLELAREVFDEEIAPDAPRVGTMQLLHPLCRHGLCDEILHIRDHEGASTPGPDAVGLGGIVQGLLDYGAIDADELADVFKEIDIEEQRLTGFHKGTLLVVSATDRSFSAESIRAAIGVSPYLLVPHAVLLHNEWWLREALFSLDEGEEKGRGKLGRLTAARAEVAKTLSQRLVPNVFHYDEERELYERGRLSRALNERQETVQRRLSAVTSEIEARHERTRSAVLRAIPVLALVFTWSDALAKHDNTLVFAVLVPTTILTLAALAFVYWRD